MDKMDIKWTAGDKPTGKYKSFSNRAWPMACLKNERESPVAGLVCEESYVSSSVDPSKPIYVRLAFYHSPEDRKTNGKGAFTWQTFNLPFNNLKEAKAGAVMLMKKYPQCYEHLVA